VGDEYGLLKAKVGEADKLLPTISGWDSDPAMECSREFLPAVEKWEKEEEKQKEEERMRKEQPLAEEVDTAAKKEDIAWVKQLQLENSDKQHGQAVRHSKWWFTLLFLMALLQGSNGADSFCQTQSGQVCKQSDPTDQTIYKCDIEEPTKESTVETFNEGETIELRAVGDKSGFGCSFEMKDTECCYIHEEREDTRGEKLCSASKQPDECRQPGSGEYKVEELDGPVGWCKLTLTDAKLNDTGVYKITFPFEPDRYNKETTVIVNEVGLNQTETAWIVFGLVVVLLVLLPVFCCFGVIRSNKNNEHVAENAFEILKKEDELKKTSEQNEGAAENALKMLGKGEADELKKKGQFKKALGKSSLFRLWDRYGNNIFHLAATSSWTEKMTNIVLGKESTDVEAPLQRYKRTDIFSHLKLPGWQSKIARWYVTHINKHYWSPKLPVLLVHLNSRNKEGDTPLMIAAAQLQMDAVKALVETGEVEVNLENNGRTALHKAVAAYPTQKIQKKDQGRQDCYDIVQYLLKNYATPKGYIDGQTPLHTAVRRGALDIVKILTKYRGKHEVKTIKSTDKREETAFQLAVRMGEGHKDIVDYLKDQDNSWKANKVEILKTVFPAVAGGHKNTLKILTDDAKLEWNDLSGECLMRAVRENNKTAVNYLYGRNLTPPKDEDRLRALELAKENKRVFGLGGEKEKEKCAKQIIEKLTTEGKPTKVESISKKGTGWMSKAKTPKGEYMELIKKIRGKSNKDIFDEMDEDMEQLATICRKIKDGRRNKISPSKSHSFLATSVEPATFSATRRDTRVCPPISTRTQKFE